MIKEVTSIEQLVRARMIETFRIQFPHLDISENSTMSDLLVDPIVSVLTPYIVKVNRNEVSDFLDNAEFVDDEELDAKIMSNYMMPRRQGTRALVVITASLINVTPDTEVEIPADSTFSDRTGELKFKTIRDMKFSYSDLLAGYVEGKELYEIEFVAEAESQGSRYNVAPGVINKGLMFHNKLVMVTNKQSAYGGSDRESNVEYAERVKDFYESRQVGTEPGYRMMLFELFDEIEDVNVQGYRDKYMMRDILEVPNKTGGTTKRHMGGMVDIYIKGTRSHDLEAEISLNTPNLFIAGQAGSIDEDSIVITNNSDKLKTPKIKEIKQEEEGIIIVLDNEDDVSYDPEKVSDIYVSYTYIDSRGAKYSRVSTFKVGVSKAELISPVINLSSVSLEGDDSVTLEDNVDLEQTGQKGTTREKNTVTVKGLDDKVNGEVLVVKYKANVTISNVGDAVLSPDNRLITNDVLCLEAPEKPLNLSFKVIMKKYEELTDEVIDAVKSAASRFISSLGLGVHVTEMEIVDFIVNDDTVSRYVSHVITPFDAFYSPNDTGGDIDDDMEYIREDAIMHVEQIEHLMINKIEVAEEEIYCCEEVK